MHYFAKHPQNLHNNFIIGDYMTSLAALSDYFSDNSTSQIEQISDDISSVSNATETLSNSASTFAQFLSNAQSSGDGISALLDTDTFTDDAVDSFQSQLLSGLGLSGIDTDSLTSDSTISALQSSLLVSLQSSLFSSITDSDDAATTASSDSAETTEDAASDEDPSSFTTLFESISSYSFGEDGLGISDGFDTVNILNHLPIVSKAYEEVSSTDVSAASSLAGGYLFGGVAGLAYQAVDLSVEGMTGQSISDKLWDFGKQLFTSAEENSDIPEEAITLGKDVYQFARQELADD